MSASATGVDDDDATMTRDAGASRTFRSIFGDGAANHDGDDELKLQRFSRRSDKKDMDTNGYRDDANDGDEGDEDDDGVWSDDAAPPKERQSGGDSDDNNNGDEQALNDSAVTIVTATVATAQGHEEDDDEVDWGSSDASAPRSDELKIPHRRSMEEWADDDDEEDAWKDMLQAKVNQLELVIQSNNEASASSQMPPAAAIAQIEFAHADSRIALATATHTASLRTTTDRPTNRNKIQRLTSGGHSQASGDSSHHRHIGTSGSGVHASLAPAVSSPSNYLRKRSGSRDFASSRAVKPADSKKSAKVASGSSSGRRDSLTRSSSASSLSTTITRSAHAAQRKNSLDACSTGSHSRSRAANCTLDAVGGSVATVSSSSAAAAVRAAPEPISDTEAVRRFILQDIKHMSMDRLVADAKRLRFFEDFYAGRSQKDEAHDDAAS